MHIPRRTALVVVALSFFAAAPPAGAQTPGLQRSIERTLKVNGPVDVTFRTGSSDLNIQPGNASSVHLRLIVKPQNSGQVISGDLDAALRTLESNPPFSQEGNRIEIGDSVGGGIPKGVSVDYELQVPAETRLDAQTHSGDLWVEGIEGPVTIETQSGDIRMKATRQKVRIHTASGDISLEQAESRGVELETTSGDVRLQLPGKAGFDLSAQTTSGDIHLSQDFEGDAKLSEHEVHLKVRGGGSPVDVRTVSGDIGID